MNEKMWRDRPFERRKDPELPDEIQNLRDSIGKDLAKLEEMLKASGMVERSVGIEFPRGHIRKADYWKSRWSFIKNADLLTDLAYRAQAHDCLRWLINRFDIDLSVLIMVTFTSIVLIASICEGLCYAACVKEMKHRNIIQSPPKEFNSMINMLHQTLHIIDADLAKNLHWLRKLRNDLHVYNSVFSGKSIKPPLGSNVKKQAIDLLHEHNKAVEVYNRLTETLEQHFVGFCS